MQNVMEVRRTQSSMAVAIRRYKTVGLCCRAKKGCRLFQKCLPWSEEFLSSLHIEAEYYKKESSDGF